uniref:RNA replicase n=1 Tax=Saccharina latissima RNA virus 2 TaxID=3153342 RepID=A0AB38ZN71_9VIRU
MYFSLQGLINAILSHIFVMYEPDFKQYYTVFGCIAGLTLMFLVTGIVWAVDRVRIMKELTFRISRTLERTKIEPAMAANSVASVFNRMDVPTLNVSSRHTHAYCAAVRTSAVTFLRQFCLTLGVPEYCVSRSRRDENLGVNGSKLWYMGIDVDKKVTNDVPKGIATLVDTDFHDDDLPEMLLGALHPIVLYTINPRVVAKSSGEVTYYFNTNNEIVMRYSGGALWQHKLWDYTSDIICVRKRVLGITLKYSLFRVEKKQMDDLRTIVCLAPLGTWVGLSAILASMRLKAKPLERLEPVHNGWAHLIDIGTTGITHSIGRAGSYQEASFSAVELAACKGATGMSNHDAMVSTTCPWLDGDRLRGLVAAEYFRDGDVKPTYVTSVEDSVRHISAAVETAGDEEERQGVTGFMSPLVTGGCYSHNTSTSNNKWGVKARITDLSNDDSTLRPFPTSCLKEFLDFFCKSGPLTPVAYDEVYANQVRPTQRAILREGAMKGAVEDTTVRSFLKKESVQGIKDPRVISTIAPRSKLEYSKYMLPVGRLMKSFRWYGFKTPVEVAADVAETVGGLPYAIEGDFSRMDGHVNAAVRIMLEEGLLRRLFPGDENVIQLHREQFKQTGRIRGMTYETGYARCSGSPETSCFNTGLTGFVAYLTNRMLGCDPVSAWDAIGLCAGDDTLTPGHIGISPETHALTFRKAARHVGQVLTGDIRINGEPVKFLSRVFGGAWYGSPNSMADPLRVIVKVHSTPNMPAGTTPQQKCYEKGLSLYQTDSNTPILGPLARKMMSVGKPGKVTSDFAPTSWWSQFENSWPNQAEDWMNDVIHEQLEDFDLAKFESWIDVGDVYNAPTCMALPEKPGSVDVLVDGELVRGKPKEKDCSNTVSDVKKRVHRRKSRSRTRSVSGRSDVSANTV